MTASTGQAKASSFTARAVANRETMLLEAEKASMRDYRPPRELT